MADTELSRLSDFDNKAGLMIRRTCQDWLSWNNRLIGAGRRFLTRVQLFPLFEQLLFAFLVLRILNTGVDGTEINTAGRLIGAYTLCAPVRIYLI